jgi:nucleoside-diphosphate-sugar epimerase
MRVFVTGATGFIGSAVSAQLIAAGHNVTGLTRSQQGAKILTAAGVEPFFGDIRDTDNLRRGVMESEGVVHTAFNHDFSKFLANCETDRLAINAMAEVLQGSERPLLITSAVGLGSSGPRILATENHFNPLHINPRKASELAAQAALKKGVNVSVIRLSQVHSRIKQGLITPLIDIAQKKGISAYVGEGENRWAAVHISDAALLYSMALSRKSPGSRYHAVAEEGITIRRIAETIGHRLNIPVVRLKSSAAPEHFGWLHKFIVQDMAASSAITKEQLSWLPKGPDLISDLTPIFS